MKRLIRLRRPKLPLETISTSSSRTIAVRTRCIAHRRDFGTTPAQQLNVTRPQLAGLFGTRSRSGGRDDSAQEVKGLHEGSEDLEQLKSESAQARNADSLATDLGLPPRIRSAGRPEDVTDPNYTPAEFGDGLEIVGGYEGWWENQANWDPSRDFQGFGPREKVSDPACLHALARMAVVEALAVRQVYGPSANEVLTGSWRRGDAESCAKALNITIQASEDGSVNLEGDVQGVVSALESDSAPGGQESSEMLQPEYIISPEAAQDLVESLDSSWEEMPLQDVWLRFAITKRLLQSTGHFLQDSKVAKVESVKDLLQILLQPPKPKKLAEDVELRGQLEDLPNVKVHSRRVTPIDKDRVIGRWKMIVQELEKRDLPVTGTGTYGPHVEKSWLAEPLKRKGFRKTDVVDANTPGPRPARVR